jgi:L-ascorbate metabolism protein UlaG (beta-lactamase superfamily)
MQLRRTANAGFLLTLDGMTIAMDGVCLEVTPYQATLPAERAKLLAAPPDLLAYTHFHEDHFDPGFAAAFRGPILGTDQVAQLLPDKAVSLGPVTVGSVTVTPVATRHIGAYGATTSHQSLVVEGSSKVWFMGDATPAQLKQLMPFGKPRVLIAPFAYATTPSALRTVNEAAPEYLVLTHLPLKNNDPSALWDAVAAQLSGFSMPVLIPELGETLVFR